MLIFPWNCENDCHKFVRHFQLEVKLYIYAFTVSCIVLTNGFVDVFSTKVSVGVFVNHVYSNILEEVMRPLAGLRMRVVK